ncbi:MAG: type II toxin-antitoxin system VapC family toxin [Gemmatimonadaceae bacterium]|nr:type II toxin-antitoxin system VapC family toxin [Gemmatimonadaceae bacterium]
MIIPDINLLVTAHATQMPQHAPAREWWRTLVASEEPVALPWVVLLGFVRLMSNRRLFTTPFTVEQATDVTRDWLALPSISVLEPGPLHLELYIGLARDAHASAELVTDLHLAALAIEHRCELHSNDADFGRFRGLRWRNPLARP